MFVQLRDVSAVKQVIATLLATALVLWASGLFSTSSAQAANITNVSDTLSDSSPAASSTHTFVFTSPSGIAVGGYATITMPTGEFGGITNLTATDVTVATTSANTVGADCTATDIGFTTSGDDLVFEFCSTANNYLSAAGSITIVVGNTSGNEMSNPASPTNGNQSYEIDISAGTSDAGHTRIVILDTVLVTASVDTVFNFTVSGVASSTAVGGGFQTSSSSGSTTLAYGTLSADIPETLGQRLNVETNARNGYVVTVYKDGAFQSSTGADIDDFVNGTTSPTLDPVPWAVPADIIDNEWTYGHWGVTSLDTDTVGNRANEFAGGDYIGIGTSSAPTVLMAHDGPSDNVTAGVGSTTVAYRVEITSLQEAGDDYSAILTYIATPTF